MEMIVYMEKKFSYSSGGLNFNIIYRFSYILYVLYAFINTTYLFEEHTAGILSQLVKYTCILLLLIYAFYKFKFKKNVLLGIIIFGGIFFINAVLNDFSLVMMLLFVVLFPNNLDPKILGKKIVCVLLFTYIFIIILAALGIINNYVEYRFLDNTIRFAMGFVSPNACATYFLYVVLIAIYSWEPKSWKLYVLCLYIFMISYIYVMTDSRMAMIYELFLFVFIISEKIGNKRKYEFFYPAVCIAFLLMMSLSIMVIIFFADYQNEWYIILNQLFSSRLGSIVNFYNEYGINLLGNSIETHGIREATMHSVKWAGIDNSYVYLLIKYGIIIFVVFFVGFIYTARQMKKRKDYLGALYLVFICLIGLTENVMCKVEINYGIIIFASTITCSYARYIYKGGYKE